MMTMQKTLHAEIDFQHGFIKDEFCKQCEPVQGREFLYTSKIPKPGQRCETNINLNNGAWCHLSGIIYDVGPLPSFHQWAMSSTFVPISKTVAPENLVVFPSHECSYPKCHSCEIRHGEQRLSFGTFMVRTLDKDGTLNGQQCSALAILNPDFHKREKDLPFARSRIYQIDFQADDSKENVWCVKTINDVTDAPREQLPKMFVDWIETFGCNCTECQRGVISSSVLGLNQLENSQIPGLRQSSDASSGVSSSGEDENVTRIATGGLYVHLCDGGLRGSTQRIHLIDTMKKQC
jgi:hypothetical protein